MVSCFSAPRCCRRSARRLREQRLDGRLPAGGRTAGLALVAGRSPNCWGATVGRAPTEPAGAPNQNDPAAGGSKTAVARPTSAAPASGRLHRADARAADGVARPDDRRDGAADDRRRPRRPQPHLVGRHRVSARADGVTPVYGKLGDLYGRKIVFQVALVIFLVGSVLSACRRASPN